MPDTFEAVIVVLVAIAPGVLFMELSRSWAPQRDRSTLRDLGLVVIASAASTASAFFVITVWLAPWWGWDDEVELILKFADGSLDLSAVGVDRLSFGLGGLLLGSLVVALALAALRRLIAKIGSQDGTKVDPWSIAEREAPDGSVIYLVVETTDGTRWIGRKSVYESNADRAKRQVVLARPVRREDWRGGGFATEKLIDAIAFDGDQVTSLSVVQLSLDVDKALLHQSAS